MKPGFFDGISQREICLSCGPVRSPCCYRDSAVLHAVFTVSTARLAPLLPDPDLHPLELRKGRALLSVAALDHRQSDLGPHRELFVGPLVVFGRRPLRVLDAVAAIVRRSASVHVLHLPVTSETARAAGQELFGFPGTLAEIAFTRGGGRLGCSVRDGGKEVLTVFAEDLPSSASRRVRATLFSTKEGALLGSQVELSLLALGQSFRHGAATIQLGPDHPIATALASLDIDPRAVLLQSSEPGEVILYAPHPAHVPLRRVG